MSGYVYPPEHPRVACPSCGGKGYPSATGPGCACARCLGTGRVKIEALADDCCGHGCAACPRTHEGAR